GRPGAVVSDLTVARVPRQTRARASDRARAAAPARERSALMRHSRSAPRAAVFGPAETEGFAAPPADRWLTPDARGAAAIVRTIVAATTTIVRNLRCRVNLIRSSCS